MNMKKKLKAGNVEMKQKYIDMLNEAKDWRDQRVWHTTPTGRRNFVKIKSLPQDEQDRWAKIRKPSSQTIYKDDVYVGNIKTQEPKDTMNPDFYLNLFLLLPTEDYLENIEENDGERILATNDGLTAMYFDDEYVIIKASNVPLEAVQDVYEFGNNGEKEIEDPDKFLDDIEWMGLEDEEMDPKEFFNFIMYGNDQLLLLEIKPDYLEFISFDK